MTRFRDRLEAAIESREPLDTAELCGLADAASAEDFADWQQQRRLDRAIAEWQEGLELARRPRRRIRRWTSAVAVTAAGFGAGWLAMPEQTVSSFLHEQSVVMPVKTTALGDEQGSMVPETDRTIASHEMTSEQFSEAAATANRLAYAFEPVGEQVGTVVRFLVDSVPGSGVFAM